MVDRVILMMRMRITHCRSLQILLWSDPLLHPLPQCVFSKTALVDPADDNYDSMCAFAKRFGKENLTHHLHHQQHQQHHLHHRQHHLHHGGDDQLTGVSASPMERWWFLPLSHSSRTAAWNFDLNLKFYICFSFIRQLCKIKLNKLHESYSLEWQLL